MTRNSLNKRFWVVKRNAVNEMRPGDMSLQEMRLFSIYLSRINPNDRATRLVTFTVDEFHQLMDTDPENYRFTYYEKIFAGLLNHKVKVPLEYGGLMMFTLFTTARMEYNPDDMVFYFRFEANEEAMPFLFDIQERYVKYELWNALVLKSANQIRMYELLKQHQYIGYRVFLIDELKEMLGIALDDYVQYRIFNRDVIDTCLSAINEKTDIYCTCEPFKRAGRGGKVISIKFTIKKNDDFKDTLGIRKYVNPSVPIGADDIVDVEPTHHLNLNDLDSDTALMLVDEGKLSQRDQLVIDLREIMKKEFSVEQVQELYDKFLSSGLYLTGNRIFHHFLEKYNYAKRVESEGDIKKSVFSLVRSIIDKS